MTKVAHIVWGLETGGIETMLANIVNRQVTSAGVTLIVINDKVNKQLLERIDPRVNVVLLARKVGSHNPLPLIHHCKLSAATPAPSLIADHTHNADW